MAISLEEVNQNLILVQKSISDLYGLVCKSFPDYNNVVDDSSDLVNLEGAAKLLDLAKNTIYDMSYKGIIPKIKRGKKLYFSKKDLMDFMYSYKIKTVDQLRAEADGCTVKARR